MYRSRWCLLSETSLILCIRMLQKDFRGMCFVMIMNPIVRKSVSKGMMIVVIVVVIVICIVGSLKLLERRKKKHGSDSSRTNSRRERKSLLIDVDLIVCEIRHRRE